MSFFIFGGTRTQIALSASTCARVRHYHSNANDMCYIFYYSSYHTMRIIYNFYSFVNTFRFRRFPKNLMLNYKNRDLLSYFMIINLE
jgi:hypothetical protein